MGLFSWFFSSWSSVNIDGSPMVEGTSVDIHGNPYGVVNTSTTNSFTNDSSYDFTSNSSCCDFSSSWGSDNTF